jgi:hypothetical protein
MTYPPDGTAQFRQPPEPPDQRITWDKVAIAI